VKSSKNNKGNEGLKEMPSTFVSENNSEVCSEGHSSNSPCSHQDGFGAFEKHTRVIGLRLLTKVGYEGKALELRAKVSFILLRLWKCLDIWDWDMAKWSLEHPPRWVPKLRKQVMLQMASLSHFRNTS
jgi:hypothetical protein